MRAAIILAAAILASGCATPLAPTVSSTTHDVASSTPPETSTTPPATSTPPPAPPPSPPAAKCRGAGTVPLNTSPMALDDFGALQPYGLVVGGHVTPIDHMYFSPADWPGHRDEYEVHAIADGQISGIGTRPSHQPIGSTNDSVEYRIWIDHTCTFHSYLDLVTSLSPRVLAWFDVHKQGGPQDPLEIRTGELLGRIGGQTLDFGVYNDELVLPGFLVLDHYNAESWKVHTDDPFLYFTEPARSQLLAKDVRLAEPRAGKIDHDVDGRAVGNWFLQGSNGYAGPVAHVDGYWSGHLAFLPDAIMPDHIIVSIGNWSGEAMQFAVRGNGPDPANASEATGLVKYELVDWDYYDADDPAGPHFHGFLRPLAHPAWVNQDASHGTLLVQLVGPRLLKVEAFPGKAAADVAGFDANAKLYER